MDMKKDAELRVLRHFANNEEGLVPEGMEKFECIASCERLEEKKYVWVAWIEGHDFEALRVLPSGLVYLKELEMEERGEQDELEQLRKENAELKAKIEQLTTYGLPSIFHDNLDWAEIKKELISVDRLCLGPKQFLLTLKEFFDGVKWLTITKNTDFVKWMKKQGIVEDCADNLSNVSHNEEMVKLKDTLKRIFQFEKSNGVWVDKEKYYKKNRAMINSGN